MNASPMIEGHHRVHAKLRDGFLTDMESLANAKRAAKGSQMLRDAILRAKGYPVAEPETVVMWAAKPPTFKTRNRKRGRPKGSLNGHTKQFRINPLVAQIQSIVAAHFKLTVEQLTSPGRGFNVSHSRQIAEYLARKKTRLSYPDIAKHFGGRDHSTVIHSCQRVEKRIADGDLETIEGLRAVYQVLGA